MSNPPIHLHREHGLWIPPEMREYEQQIVIRTPRTTIQHFGGDGLDAYYGLVDASHFGTEDEFWDPKNTELCPDQVSIKPQCEPAEVDDVDIHAQGDRDE